MREESFWRLQNCRQTVICGSGEKKKSVFIKNIANALIKDHNGIVPNDRKYLETLSGVGRKTINVFLAEYYKVPTIAVHTHVERVSKRLKIANN